MSTEQFEAVAFARLADTPADASARREAERRGYAAGYAAGARRAEQQLTERARALESLARQQQAERESEDRARAQRLDRVLAALEARTEPVLADARHTLLAAAIELAGALLGRELDDRELSARAIAQRIIDADPEHAVTRVRVHPSEVAAVSEFLAARGLEVVADDELAPGDAIAELPAGLLDARIAAALDRVRRALAEEERA